MNDTPERWAHPAGVDWTGEDEEIVLSDDVWMSLVEWREDPGDGERDWKLDR